MLDIFSTIFPNIDIFLVCKMIWQPLSERHNVIDPLTTVRKIFKFRNNSEILVKGDI